MGHSATTSDLPSRVIGAGWGIATLALTSLFAMCVGVCMLPFIPIPRGRRERYIRPLARLWGSATIAVLFPRVRVTGAIDLAPGQGALIISNHRSWFDPPLIIAKTGAMGFSKKLVLFIPFVGLFGWLGGTVFFNRKSKEARRRARDDLLHLLRSGNCNHLFPEGTRSRDGELRSKIYLTAVLDCYENDLPVIPCALHGTERVLPTPMDRAVPFQSCRLHFAEPVWPRDFDSAEAFANHCWNRVRQEVGRLRVEDGELAPDDPRANVGVDIP